MAEALAILAGLAAVAWFWNGQLRARERAVCVGRRVCARERLQLLDETVSLVRIGLARNRGGRLVLRRLYEFEFSTSGADRGSGLILMRGLEVQDVQLRAPGWVS